MLKTLLAGDIIVSAEGWRTYSPALITAAYAFLTIRFEDTSILDFISYACAYFFRQQFFEWRMTR